MRNGGEGAVEAEPVPDALFGFGFSVVAEARPCGAAGGEAAAEADDPEERSRIIFSKFCSSTSFDDDFDAALLA